MKLALRLLSVFFIGSGIAFATCSVVIIVHVIREPSVKSDLFMIAISIVLVLLGIVCCQKGISRCCKFFVDLWLIYD
jgi:hypothetical protein